MASDINTSEIEETESNNDLYPEITNSTNEIDDFDNGLIEEPTTTTDDSLNIDPKSLTTPTTLNSSTSTANSTYTNYSSGTGNKLIFFVWVIY